MSFQKNKALPIRNFFLNKEERDFTLQIFTLQKPLGKKPPKYRGHTHQQTGFGLWQLLWLSSHCPPRNGSPSLINILEVAACFPVLVFPVVTSEKTW
jgi:hypothetical protein